MTVLLTLYMLMWPVIVLAVLLKIATAFFGDVAQARKEGRPVI
jgi:hypothetical protein